MRRFLLVWGMLLCLPPFAVAGQQPVSLLPLAARDVGSPAALALSASGRFVAVATRHDVRLLDATTLEPLRTIPAGAEPTAIAIDDAGARVFVADRRRDLRVLDAATGAALAETRLPERPTAIDLSADGRFVAVGLSGGRVIVLTDALRVVRQLEAPDFHDREVAFVAWGQGGAELFAATADGALAYWGGASSTPIRSSSPNRTEIVAAARDFSGDMLAIGVKSLKLIRERGQMGAEAAWTVEVLDWRRGQRVAAIELGARQLSALAVAPLRTAVATIDVEGELVVWDIGRGDRLATVRGPEDATRLAFDADGRRLVALAPERVDLWEASGLGSPDARIAVDFAREFDRRKFEITTDSVPLIRRADGGRIAILGLAPLGADSVLARSADNLLASQLANSSGLALVERDALDRVLREVRFQNSGITSADEAARIGEMLNASRVIVGSVSQLGSVTVLSARVIDVQTSAVLGAREVRCNQCRPEDLPEAIQLLARMLVEL